MLSLGVKLIKLSVVEAHLFFFVTYEWVQQARLFVQVKSSQGWPSQHSVMFVGEDRSLPYPLQPYTQILD